MKTQTSCAGVQVLSTAAAIARKIRWVLGNPKESRLALVAFVGANPLRFIPHPNGLRVYCWPQVPGTNPKGLRDLLRRGVKLHGVERLHMKLYWSPSRGAVVGSANLSAGALSRGQNIELAVHLPAGIIDARAMVKRLSARKLSDAEIGRLEKRYDEYQVWEKAHVIKRKAGTSKGLSPEQISREKYKKRKQAFAIRGIATDDPSRLVLSHKRVVFTGKCQYGTRPVCELAVRQAGGQSDSTVTINTDVLIIGAKGSPHWTWTKYGKKIKKADELRRHYGKPLIVLEERWR
jgi:hypothetical protein